MKFLSNNKIFALLLTYFAFASLQLSAKTNVLSNSSLSPTQLIDSLFSIATDYNESEQYEISLSYLKQALDLSSKHPGKYLYSKTLVSLGRIYLLTNNYSLSQDYLFKFLEENDINSNQEMIADAFSLIANNYNSLGNINASHEYSLKSIKIYETLNDSVNIANGYYNLGSLFFYQDVFEKALDYYKRANKIGCQIKNPKIIYNSTAAMGSTYGSMEQTDLALELNYKSLHIADSLNYLTGKAYSSGNIGSNYLVLKDYKKAKKYIEQSLELKQEIDDKWGQIGAHLTLSELYSRTNNIKLAEKNILTALEIAKRINAKKRLANIYEDIADFYLSIDKKDLAIEYLKKHITAKDSFMNENILREMSNRKSEFAIQKKEYEIDLLKKDNEILETQEKAQNFKLIGIGFLALSFLIISLFYRSSLSKQKRFTEVLEEKNKEIEKQKSKIQIQNKELESSNEDLEQFAYVASHDLREPLRMISSYGKILTNRYKDTLDKNGQEFLHYMTDAANRMDSLLLNLLDYAKTSSNAQPFQQVSSAGLMRSLSKITENLFLEKNGILEVKEENLPVITGRETQLYQLFQNLITNGVKYNHSDKPHLIVDCKTLSEKYVFSFQDNGIGIPKEHQSKIFEMFQRLDLKGEFEGTGIGLATCKKIADIHGGHITVESEEGKGSTFFLHLPK